MELDEKDFLILNALKENSRHTINEISKKTKIRPSTVHQRINHLKKNRIIEKFTVKLNDKEIGQSFTVFMLVKGATGDYIDLSTKNDPNIKEIYGITGEYDLLIKMKFSNVDKFNDFILKFRSKRGVRYTMTMVATAKIKEEI